MFLITLVGIIVLVLGVAQLPPLAKSLSNKKKQGSWVRGGSFILAGGFAIFIQSLVFWADASQQYIVLKPGGKIEAMIDAQGIKWKGFAKIKPWSKFIDVRTPTGVKGEDLSDVEGILSPVSIRFIDQVTGNAYLTTRFQLPTSEETFISLYKEFKSLSNLVSTTLLPTVREVVSNTGYMFAAQDYISGSASDFRITIKEQLEGGSYSVEKREHRDTVITAIEADNREIKEIQTRYEVIRRVDNNGNFIRIPNDINDNQILVSQVIIDDVALEDVFKQRLEAQRDESAKRQLEQQKIKTARDAQARIIAEGERDKAAERVTQEKLQVSALISIETKLKQEETNKKLAQIQLETERLSSQALKVKQDAIAYANKKLVAAGLTPQEKAQLEKDIAIGVAKEIAKLKFPETMIMGSDGKGTPLEALIGASMAKQLGVKTGGK